MNNIQSLINPKTGEVLTIDYDQFADQEYPLDQVDAIKYYIDPELDYDGMDNSADLNEQLLSIVFNGNEDKYEQAVNKFNNSHDLINYINDNILNSRKQEIVPFSEYKHSLVNFFRGNVYDWDCGPVGFALLDYNKLAPNQTKEDLLKIIDQDLDMITNYTDGDVYTFGLCDTSGDIKDSIGGVYIDLNDEKEVKSMINDYLGVNVDNFVNAEIVTTISYRPAQAN